MIVAIVIGWTSVVVDPVIIGAAALDLCISDEESWIGIIFGSIMLQIDHLIGRGNKNLAAEERHNV